MPTIFTSAHIQDTAAQRVGCIVQILFSDGTTAMTSVCALHHRSASPPVRFPNVYGVDIGVQSELIAHERDNDEIALVSAALLSLETCPVI
jgi:glutamine phosphoribosylpyrophosphate amidotransferase